MVWRHVACVLVWLGAFWASAAIGVEFRRVDGEWAAVAVPDIRQMQWLRNDDALTTAAVTPGIGSRTLWFSAPCYGRGPCPQQLRAAMAGGILPPRGARVQVQTKKGPMRALRGSDLVPITGYFQAELSHGALKIWAEARGF